MRIFVPEQFTSQDYSEAHKHGEVHFLADKLPNASQNPTAFFSEAVKAIEDSGFNKEKDYLCMTGYPTNLAVLMSAFAHLGILPINLLLFNFKCNQYYKRTLTIKEANNA